MEAPEERNGQRAKGGIAVIASVCGVMPLFAAARVFAMTSLSENFGLAAFEAMRRRMGDGVEASWYTLHLPQTVPLRGLRRPSR